MTTFVTLFLLFLIIGMFFLFKLAKRVHQNSKTPYQKDEAKIGFYVGLCCVVFFSAVLAVLFTFAPVATAWAFCALATGYGCYRLLERAYAKFVAND